MAGRFIIDRLWQRLSRDDDALLFDVFVNVVVADVIEVSDRLDGVELFTRCI